MTNKLLTPTDPDAVGIAQPRSTSPAVFTCEHASNLIPSALNNLGLADGQLARHIAWDIGALAVARAVSAHMGATLIYQRFSRLVIDCNRLADATSSIVTESDGTPVPGNQGVDERARGFRKHEILDPYHAAIERTLDDRACASAPVLIAMHSYTPALASREEQRPWHIGVLAGEQRQLADTVLRLLQQETDWCIGDNQPYGVGLWQDYTIPIHGDKRGIANVELEIRQDLIGDRAGQQRMAALLSDVLPRAIARLGSANSLKRHQ